MENAFLGTNGLTSTEANYYANVAKELTEQSTKYLSNLKLYNEYIASLSGTDWKLMTKGLESIDVKTHLNLISTMNIFCAWVREGIKAKDKLLANLNSITLEEWAIHNNIQIPEKPEPIPTSIGVTEEDILNEWDTEKRLRYLSLEASAATIGKYIHPNGPIAKAREAYYEALNNPIRQEVIASNIVLYSTSTTIPEFEVESMFLKLQVEHRNNEKELNSLKAELKSTLNKRILLASQKRKEDMDKFDAEYKDYVVKKGKISVEFNEWKTKEQERISGLRIFLPPKIRQILDEIKKMINE